MFPYISRMTTGGRRNTRSTGAVPDDHSPSLTNIPEGAGGNPVPPTGDNLEEEVKPEDSFPAGAAAESPQRMDALEAEVQNMGEEMGNLGAELEQLTKAQGSLQTGLDKMGQKMEAHQLETRHKFDLILDTLARLERQDDAHKGEPARSLHNMRPSGPTFSLSEKDEAVLLRFRLPEEGWALCQKFGQEGKGTLDWDLVYEEGVIKRSSTGWRRYIAAHGPLPVLVPWWVAQGSSHVDKAGARNLLPVLVDKIPNPENMAKSSRVTSAWCDTLESYARSFMEAMAQIGPGARGELFPDNVNFWHTDLTLVQKAAEGLSLHSALRATLQRTRVKTLPELFDLAANILGLDEESQVMEAGDALYAIRITQGTLQDLRNVRSKFAAAAAVLQDNGMSDEALTQAFKMMALNGKPPIGYRRIFHSRQAQSATTWLDLWQLLYTHRRQAETQGSLEKGPVPATTRNTLAPLNALEVAAPQVYEQELEDVPLNAHGVHEGMEDEEVRSLNLMTAFDVYNALDGICFLCHKKGHSAKDCTHKGPATWEDPELSRACTYFAKRAVTAIVRNRAQGARAPESGIRTGAKMGDSRAPPR